jgi:hypothetical protein
MRLRRLLSVLFVASSAGCGDACDPSPPPTTAPSTQEPQGATTSPDPVAKGTKATKVDLEKIFGTPPDAGPGDAGTE